MSSEPLTASERRLLATAAGHQSWANTTDRAARTQPGRSAFLERFERQVDPERKLDPAERAVRAEHARRAYFALLALKSARSRRASGRVNSRIVTG